MIRLTTLVGDNLYVNPEHIVDVSVGSNVYYESGTVVTTIRSEYFVKESPEEVASKIIKWKLLMEGYRGMEIAMAVTSNQAIAAGIAESMYHQKTAIDRLAGLEEQKDE